MMARRIAADAILTFHILFALFLLVGWAYPAYRPLYLTLLIAWPVCWALFDYCPFTKWELMIRKIDDPRIDTDTELIRHYVHKYFGIWLPLSAVYTGGIVVFLALLYASLSQ